jgi:hypothetical protein
MSQYCLSTAKVEVLKEFITQFQQNPTEYIHIADLSFFVDFLRHFDSSSLCLEILRSPKSDTEINPAEKFVALLPINPELTCHSSIPSTEVTVERELEGCTSDPSEHVIPDMTPIPLPMEDKENDEDEVVLCAEHQPKKRKHESNVNSPCHQPTVTSPSLLQRFVRRFAPVTMNAPALAETTTSTTAGVLAHSQPAIIRRARKPWTSTEDEWLRRGVVKCGVGNWSQISFEFGTHFQGRDNVALKDRWRILTKGGTS